jgi:hypothetical protein
VRLLELQRYYSWIIDRFHLSTQAFQWATRGKRYDFCWLEERLVPLDFRLAAICHVIVQATHLGAVFCNDGAARGGPRVALTMERQTRVAAGDGCTWHGALTWYPGVRAP